MSELTAPSKTRYSAKFGEIIAALSAAQGEYPEIPKNREATVTGKTKANVSYSYKYKYADISDVLAAVRPTNAKHGLAITQPTILDGGVIYIYTRLMHKSEQWIESEWAVCSYQNMTHQDIGKALTYSRRYALCSLLAIQAEEDVDAKGGGAEVGDRPPQETRASRRTPPPAVVSSAPGPTQTGEKPLPPRAGETEPFFFKDSFGEETGEQLSERQFVSDLRTEMLKVADAGMSENLTALMTNNTDAMARVSEDSRKAIGQTLDKANKALRKYKKDHEHDEKPEDAEPADGLDLGEEAT